MAFGLAVYASPPGLPQPTQDSLPAVGQTLLGGLSTRRVPTEGFRVFRYISSSFPKLCLAQSQRPAHPPVRAVQQQQGGRDASATHPCDSSFCSRPHPAPLSLPAAWPRLTIFGTASLRRKRHSVGRAAIPGAAA